MIVSKLSSTTGVDNEVSKTDMPSDLLIEQVQVDTDFDTYEDSLHPNELTIKWRFTLFSEGMSPYTVNHLSRFAVSELNDATMPDEDEIEHILRISHDGLKEAVENRTQALPGFIKVEDFSTVDVFEHSQQIKRLLTGMNERNNLPGSQSS